MRLDEAIRSGKRFGHLGSGWHEPPVRDGDKRYWTAADVLATDWEVEREPRWWIVHVDSMGLRLCNGNPDCESCYTAPIRVREVIE